MNKLKGLSLFLLTILIASSCTKDEADKILVQNPPTAVKIESSDITSNSANISWSASTDPEGTTINYTVKLDGNMVVENVTELSYELEGLVAETDYTISIIANDQDQQSTASDATFSTTKIVKEEVVDLTIALEVTDITDESAIVNWSQTSTPIDNSVLYTVSVDGTEIATELSATSYDFANFIANTEYEVIITAYNAEQTIAKAITFATKKAAAAAPSSFNIQMVEPLKYQAAIGWSESTDPQGGDITYDLYIGSDLIKADLKTFDFFIENLRPETIYKAKIIAKNDAGLTTEVTREFSTRIEFFVESVKIYGPTQAAGTTFDPSILVKGLHNFNETTPIVLQIGPHSFPIEIVDNNFNANIIISQTVYDEIEAGGYVNALIQYNDYTDQSTQTHFIDFTFQ